MDKNPIAETDYHLKLSGLNHRYHFFHLWLSQPTLLAVDCSCVLENISVDHFSNADFGLLALSLPLGGVVSQHDLLEKCWVFKDHLLIVLLTLRTLHLLTFVASREHLAKFLFLCQSFVD